MFGHADEDTPFHIDFDWWANSNKNFDRFLMEILGSDAPSKPSEERLDYIDPNTAEVYRLPSLWTSVLIKRAQNDDYITPATPMTNAILRALVENRNCPMTADQLHQRIGRGNPKTILRLLRTARMQYGIAPAESDECIQGA